MAGPSFEAFLKSTTIAPRPSDKYFSQAKAAKAGHCNRMKVTCSSGVSIALTCSDAEGCAMTGNKKVTKAGKSFPGLQPFTEYSRRLKPI
jgi:hypothetical protein